MYGKKSMAKKRSCYKMKAAAYGNNPIKKNFPDLTGDGKVTQADILKGRGVELNSPAKKYASDAQRKAVHASKADGGKGAPAKMYKNSPAKAEMPEDFKNLTRTNYKKDKEVVKRKKNNVARVEPKKVKKITTVNTSPRMEKQEAYVKPSQKDIKKAKRKALIGKIFGDGSKRKANEERRKKNLSKSVTGRMKLRSEKFRRR